MRRGSRRLRSGNDWKELPDYAVGDGDVEISGVNAVYNHVENGTRLALKMPLTLMLERHIRL